MNLRLGYWAALLLALPVYWPRLVRSLWLDEAGTYWMSAFGFGEAVARTSGFAGQSMLYSLIVAPFCLPEGPWMELVLRLPSVLGLGLALYFTSRLAARLAGPECGLAAFIFLLLHPLSSDVFIQARSYGLAAAAVAASFYLLCEWLEERRWKLAMAYGIAAALVVHLHFVYSVALGAQALVVAWVFFREGRRENWRQMAAAAGLIAGLVLPLAGGFLRTASNAGVLSYERQPDAVDLGLALVPMPLTIVALGLGVLAAFAVRARPDGSLVERVWVIWGAWWVFGTLVLFGVSQIGETRLFVPRYLGSAAPGLAGLLAAAGARFLPPRAVLGWSFAVLLALAGPWQWRQARQPSGVEAKPMIEAVRAISPGNAPPLLFQSSYVEANSLPWRKGPGASHAFAELAAYPVHNKVFGLPVELDPDAQYYVQGLLDGELRAAPEIVFVRGGELPEWILLEMAGRGYRVERLRPNAYSVAVFRR
jgi:hypothetical protein